ncbi:MAG: hypothetical protein ACOYN3_00595 [Acidimicrobiia bacterium]
MSNVATPNTDYQLTTEDGIAEDGITGDGIDPTRPGPSFRTLAWWTSLVALATFLVLGVAQYIGMQTTQSSFPRLRAPGAEKLLLTKGSADVWVEQAKAFPMQPGTMTVHVYDTLGNEVPLNPSDAGQHYWTPRRTGTSVGSVVLPATDLYTVAAQGGGGNFVSVGRTDRTFARAWMIMWFILAAFAAVACVVTGLALLRARRAVQTDTTA